MGSRPRRLAPDIEDVGTFLGEHHPVRYRRFGIGNSPPSEKLSGVTLTIPMSQDGRGSSPHTVARAFRLLRDRSGEKARKRARHDPCSRSTISIW